MTEGEISLLIETDAPQQRCFIKVVYQLKNEMLSCCVPG